MLNYIRTKLFLIKKKDKKMWGAGIFSKELNINFELFLSPEELSNQKLIENLTFDIASSYLKYGATPREYFLFEFRAINNDKRKRFLTNMHKDKSLLSLLTYDTYKSELRDKYNFFLTFKEYFKRDVCQIFTGDDYNIFKDFIIAHPICFIKPLDGMCGAGVQKICCSESSSLAEFHRLMGISSKGWILEELITQNDVMAAWNESSINTIRIPSFLKNNSIIILKPFFRVGRRGMVVDNAAMGGVFSVISNEGELITDGYDEFGNSFELHPDSGLRFKGWKVPDWDKLILLVEKLHRLLPNHPYIGWDFCLTKTGWVLIEGDWGQFISEYADKEGIKDVFDDLLA